MNELWRPECEIVLLIPSGVSDGEVTFAEFRAFIRVLGRSSAIPEGTPERLGRELSCLIRCEAYPAPGTELVWENIRYAIRRTVTRRDIGDRMVAYQCIAGE